MQCLFMEKNQIDYYKDSIEEIKEIREKEKKPKLLLHVCCGPCACYPLVFLLDLFDITILYSNSNIYTFSEYQKRVDTLNQLLKFLKTKFNKKINVIYDEYNYDEFRKDLIEYKNEKEMGKRCQICINKRLNRLFLIAKEKGFNYVTTVMSISRNKDASYLNKAGKEMENQYENIKYLVTDFKKHNGQERGVMIAKKLDLYRQNYCGCEFSIVNRGQK